MGLGFSDFSETHQKILRKLQDGLDHHRDELLQCLPDPEMSDYQNLNNHISMIRKKLKTVKQDIVCVHPKMQVHYRWVRLRGYMEEF